MEKDADACAKKYTHQNQRQQKQTRREVDGETLKELGQIRPRGAVAHKAEACVGRQPLQHALKRFQVLLCTAARMIDGLIRSWSWLNSCEPPDPSPNSICEMTHATFTVFSGRRGKSQGTGLLSRS